MDGGLLSTLQKIKLTSHVKRCSNDDFVDRINGFYTPLIFAIFTIVICTKSYIVGQPLQCWIPIHFSDGWESYSESWCYIKNTYYVPPSEDLPKENEMREQTELQYYQWVPFVLSLQAALFVLPGIFWKFASWQAKIHLTPIIQRAVKSSFESGETRTATLKSIAGHIRDCLFSNNFTNSTNGNVLHRVRDKPKCGGFFNTGVYLTLCYIMTKLYYLLNIVIQFIIIQNFLKTDWTYGFTLVTKLLSGLDWQKTGLFPRVTLCDFIVPRVGQPLSTTMQCVLVINLFNEKIYIFIWFWLVFVFILTFISLLVWTARMLFGRRLSNFMSKNSEYVTDQNLRYAYLECESNMSCDSYFSLRMINTNCGIMTTRRIIDYLIENFTNLSEPNKYNSLPPNYQDLMDSKDKRSTISSNNLI